MPCMSTDGSEPDLISAALSGYFAQILPYSDTCRYCSVRPRVDVATMRNEPLSHIISVTLSMVSRRPSRMNPGSRS